MAKIVQMWMSALKRLIIVTPMHFARTPLDHSSAFVTQVLLGMGLAVLTSMNAQHKRTAVHSTLRAKIQKDHLNVFATKVTQATAQFV